MAATLAKTKLTAKQQESILVRRGMKEAEAKNAVATASSTTANVAATATTGLLASATLSLKQL